MIVYVKRKELIKLEHLSILEINGKGSFDLLQGQITSDMEKVSYNNCVLGSICDIKGRVVSSFITALNEKENNSFFLVGETNALKATLKVLEKYQPFYDCSMEQREDIKFYAIEESSLIKDFPESVSIGLAWGVSISFTPLLGLHLIICYSGTILMRVILLRQQLDRLLEIHGHFLFFFFYQINFV